MGVSRSDREYWMLMLKREIDRKRSLLYANIDMQAAYIEAATELAKSVGAEDLLQEYQNLNEKDSVLDKELSQVRLKLNRIREDLARKLEIRGYGGYDMTYGNIATSEKGKPYLKKVLESSEHGRQYLTLEQEKDNVEMSLMLATTDEKLREFVEKTLKELGVEVS